MPREIKTRSYNVCEPCKYHHRVNAFYGSHNSWTDWECKHPDAKKSEFQGSNLTPAQKAVIAKIDALTKSDGRWIGITDKQPHWCPLKKLTV